MLYTNNKEFADETHQRMQKSTDKKNLYSTDVHNKHGATKRMNEIAGKLQKTCISKKTKLRCTMYR